MKLKDWLRKNKITRKRMCEAINYNERYFDKILAGDMIPGKKMAQLIEEYTDGAVTKEDLGYKEKEKCLCPYCGRKM